MIKCREVEIAILYLKGINSVLEKTIAILNTLFNLTPFIRYKLHLVKI